MSIEPRARAAGQAVRHEASRLTAPDLTRIETRRRKMRMVASFTGTAAAVIAAVGVIGLLRTAEPQDAVTPPPPTAGLTTTTTTVPEDTTAPTVPETTTTTIVAGPAITVGTNGWSLLPALDGEATYADFPIWAGAAGPGRIVAVGGVTPPGGFYDDSNPAVWVSDDAQSWSRLAPEQVPGIGELTDVTWHNSGFVAVGQSGRDAAAWWSPDGLTWEQTVISSARPDGSARMESVVSVADGVVAAGYEVYAAGPDDLNGRSPEWVSEDFDAAAWFSPDGRDWFRLEDPTLGEPGYQDNDNGHFNSRIIGVADAGWGVVFAGYASESDPTTDYPFETTAVWVLREEWVRIDLGTEDQIKGIAAGDGTAVIHGSSHANPQADAVFYASTDGINWQTSAGDLDGLGVPDGLQFVHDIMLFPDRWVAVGTDEKDFSTVGGAAVWTAPPGVPLDWTRVEHDDSVFGELVSNPLGTMLDIAMWDDKPVVFGAQALMVDIDGGRMCCEYAPSIWLGDPP